MPRTLTDEQKSTITAAIGPSGVLALLIDGTVDDANAFALEIATLFSDAGWGVQTESLARAWGATPTGLAFLSEGDLPIRDKGQALLTAFVESGVDHNIMDAMLPEDVDVKLLVGRVGV